MRLGILILTILLAGCGYAPSVNPPLLLVDTHEQASGLARSDAAYLGGTFHQILCCESMKPAIQNGDWIVVKKTAWSDALLGRMLNYAPRWNNGNPVVHRAVSGNAANGFIASGDNNPRSEPDELVTRDKYLGEVVAIYRVK